MVVCQFGPSPIRWACGNAPSSHIVSSSAFDAVQVLDEVPGPVFGQLGCSIFDGVQEYENIL